MCRWPSVRSSCLCWWSFWMVRSPNGSELWPWSRCTGFVCSHIYCGEKLQTKAMLLRSCISRMIFVIILCACLPWPSYVLCMCLCTWCRSFCQSYDMKQHSTKVFRDIVNALGSFIQSLFIVPSIGNVSANTPAGLTFSRAQTHTLKLYKESLLQLLLVHNSYLIWFLCSFVSSVHIPSFCSSFHLSSFSVLSSSCSFLFCFVLGGSVSGTQASAQGGPGAAGGPGSLSTQAAFEYRGMWIPLMSVSVQGSAKAT